MSLVPRGTDFHSTIVATFGGHFLRSILPPQLSDASAIAKGYLPDSTLTAAFLVHFETPQIPPPLFSDLSTLAIFLLRSCSCLTLIPHTPTTRRTVLMRVSRRLSVYIDCKFATRAILFSANFLVGTSNEQSFEDKVSVLVYPR